MKCPYCHEEIPDGSKRCPICYEELNENNELNETNAEQNKPASQEIHSENDQSQDEIEYLSEDFDNENGNHGHKTRAIIICCIALAIIGIAAFLPYSKIESILSPQNDTVYLRDTIIADSTLNTNPIEEETDSMYQEEVEGDAEQVGEETETRFNAKIGKYPVTIVLAPGNQLFYGEYVGYLFYNSKGEDNKIWLKIENDPEFDRNILTEYYNGQKAGYFYVDFSIDLRCDYVTYHLNSDIFNVDFEEENKINLFVSLLESHGFKMPFS